MKDSRPYQEPQTHAEIAAMEARALPARDDDPYRVRSETRTAADFESFKRRLETVPKKDATPAPAAEETKARARKRTDTPAAPAGENPAISPPGYTPAVLETLRFLRAIHPLASIQAAMAALAQDDAGRLSRRAALLLAQAAVFAAAVALRFIR